VPAAEQKGGAPHRVHPSLGSLGRNQKGQYAVAGMRGDRAAHNASTGGEAQRAFERLRQRAEPREAWLRQGS